MKLRYALRELNKDVQARFPANIRHRFYITEARLQEVLSRDRGRCRFCGQTFDYKNKPHFRFYKPLKFGGSVKADNIVTICIKCRVPHRPTHRVYRSCTTLADLVEKIAIEVNRSLSFESFKKEEFLKETPNLRKIAEWDLKLEGSREYKAALKKEFDTFLAETLDIVYYKPYKENEHFTRPIFIEGKNNISEQVDNLIAKITQGVDDLSKEKQQLSSSLEKTIRQREYIILHPEEEEDDGMGD